MKRIVMFLLAPLFAMIFGAGFWLYTPDVSRASLEPRYAAPPSTFVEAAGITLHVRDTGPRDARAVVMLHGFGSSLHTWDAWADALSADHRVIRFDLPGFGLTGPDPTGDYSDERSIAVLAALMDRLGVARAALIGNSMGGRIAWRFAAAHPERVTKLVLVSPDGFAGPGVTYGARSPVPMLVRILPYTLPTFLLRQSIAPSYADPKRLSDAVVERYRDMMLAPGVRDAIVARMGQMTLADPVPLLRRITAPTLLLWGEKDAMIPFRNAADYMAALPHATLVPLPTLGHVPMEEAPEVSLPPVRAFLAEDGGTR
jgi:pimeloyl-ACP methyl ester carboxylesterase